MLITDWQPVGEQMQIREVGKFTEVAWIQKERDTIVFKAMLPTAGTVYFDDIYCGLVGWKRFIPDWFSAWFDRTLACKATIMRAESEGAG